VVAEPAVAALAEQYFTGRVVLQTGAQRAVAAAASAWDLAQFELLRSRRARTRKHLSTWGSSLLRAPHWRAARWAAVALLIVNLGGLQAWAWKEQAALNARRAAIRDVLTSTFPDIRVVVDAPLQMQRSLATLQRQNGATSSADLEEMLGRFQAVAPEIAAPTAIEFMAGELRLKLPTTGGVDMDSVNARVQAHGYSGQIQGDTLVLKQGHQP
jgi:general secretion pathway protein L